MRNDDSCSRCGHISDGSDHIICPSECGVCGYIGHRGHNGCPACYSWELFSEMTPDEKMCLKELLSGN